MTAPDERPIRTLRALTVRQPWAWAIIHGGKDVENRTQNIAGAYRGPVAIHAGLAFDQDARDDMEAGLWRDLTPSLYETAGRGAIIGVVDLVDVHTDDECYDLMAHPGDMCSQWAMGDHHHLILANPRPLPRPLPAKGRLGLWIPDGALQDAIWEQVDA